MHIFAKIATGLMAAIVTAVGLAILLLMGPDNSTSAEDWQRQFIPGTRTYMVFELEEDFDFSPVMAFDHQAPLYVRVWEPKALGEMILEDLEQWRHCAVDKTPHYVMPRHWERIGGKVYSIANEVTGRGVAVTGSMAARQAAGCEYVEGGPGRDSFMVPLEIYLLHQQKLTNPKALKRYERRAKQGAGQLE